MLYFYNILMDESKNLDFVLFSICLMMVLFEMFIPQSFDKFKKITINIFISYKASISFG